MSALFLLLLIVAVLVPRALPGWLRWTVLILIGIPVVLFIAFIALTAHISHSIDLASAHRRYAGRNGEDRDCQRQRGNAVDQFKCR